MRLQVPADRDAARSGVDGSSEDSLRQHDAAASTPAPVVSDALEQQQRARSAGEQAPWVVAASD
jgi:hypothetical protein